jgi:hypothetical protein
MEIHLKIKKQALLEFSMAWKELAAQGRGFCLKERRGSFVRQSKNLASV